MDFEEIGWALGIMSLLILVGTLYFNRDT